MQQNVGSADRIIRVVGAALLAMLLFGANLSSPLLKAWMIMPLVLLATAALGFCSLYALLGLLAARSGPEPAWRP